MFRKIIFQIMLMIIAAGFAAAADPVVTIGAGNGLRGDTVQVPVMLTNVSGVSLSAISVDVGFDTNALETPSAIVGPAGTDAGKFVAFNPNFSPGVMRVALIGINQNVINNGIIFYVTFRIKSAALCGATVLTSKPSGSTPDGQYVTMSGVNGAINVVSLLSVSKTGTGSGTVMGTVTGSITGTGINCGADCSDQYICNANVTLTAVPNTGSTFAGWSEEGPDCSDGSVTMDINKSCVATFTTNTYTVTPAAGPGGSIDPPLPQTVRHNETTSFTATPNTGYHIASFNGTCGGSLSGNTYTTNPVTANCMVTATFATNTYTVTPSAGANGSISPNTPQTVNYNQQTSFTVTPSIGYHIASVTGCGGFLSGSTYMTGLITSDCAVTATFATNTYTVTPSAGAGGSISPSTPQTVNYNQTTSFTVTPSTGYRIASVTGCGGTLSGSTFTTGPITSDCAVTASFATNAYTVTPSAGANGSISPNTPQTVNYNQTTSFTVTPSTGYHIALVTGTCGGTLSGNTYTTNPVTADCTVTASFTTNTYTVTPSAGAGGSISPSTPQTVNYSQTTSFTVTPSTEYYIASVTGTCGGTLSGNTYTTNPATADCTVTAGFAMSGDCNGDGIVTVDEVQAAVNMHLGLMSVTECVDLNHDGLVDISEVQTVINNHLK
jgi:hypothetical protein